MEKISKIFTGSIFKDNKGEEEDGIIRKISVMSRHTENDGKTPDQRIEEGISFDEWRQEFGPPAKLIGAYYRDEISFEKFEKEYLGYLRSEKIKPMVESFAKRCCRESIILLCVEDNPEKCHRRLLAEELKRYEPHLTIVHK